MASIDIDEPKIQTLLNRGVENIYPSKAFLESQLKSGKQLRIYFGIDPTGPNIHLGHAIPLRKMRQFQDLGHKIVLLIGSFTAMIGDPDKASVRNQLTKEEVVANMQNYLAQASKIIDTKDLNVFEIRYNDEWLVKMNFEDVLNLASKMTVQQMVERDLFHKRISEGKPVYLHEFMYPLMQGYDSVALDVDGEVGGNDQTFNMLTGRTLMKELKGKEKFVLTTKLLVDPTGKKMGKSEGNMLTLSDTPEDMFGKIMSWNDGMIVSGFELCTNMIQPDIDAIAQKLNDPSYNPKEAKQLLAHTVVSEYFDKATADRALESFNATFQKGEIPEQVPEITGPISLLEALKQSQLVDSNSEARRLVDSGAVTNMTTDQKVADINTLVDTTTVFRIGKHRFVKIVV